ncbi:carbohydrate ABC transporter permease [Actinomyces minihominis]|uniref:carbohydrate ABC transporter permease n=1 Tax=Actinomyces minihominis TaxID=2002838 RepID=UPI000C08714A|nr:carbohydrate ABC transporter permease [Actinomyces minihominis]
MSATSDTVLAQETRAANRKRKKAENENMGAVSLAKKSLSSRFGSLVAILIAIMWTVPTLGLFITSFRPEAEIKTTGWWTFFIDPKVTLSNYEAVLFGTSSQGNLLNYLINSLVITIPATIAPLAIAVMAAYAFSFMKWRGRDLVFVVVFAMQIVPLQMALIPLLRVFSSTFGKSFPFMSIWVAHTAFALPLAIFLLHNFMQEIPKELIEAAEVDGAGHVGTFLRVVLPLMVPAIASFAIFQFLWVWNDLLVGLTFSGGQELTAPLTARLQSLAGSRGQDWHLLTAGAFISMIIPLVVFFSLQRYFVRGLTAGSVKG